MMLGVAQERIKLLFDRAEEASHRGAPVLAKRYVALARRIGTRYNVRLTPEQRDRFCRACMTYFVEGVSVRTRLRSGRRVRTCGACGRSYRRNVGLRSAKGPAAALPSARLGGPVPVPVDELSEDEELDGGDGLDEA